MAAEMSQLEVRIGAVAMQHPVLPCEAEGLAGVEAACHMMCHTTGQAVCYLTVK